jgi:DNA-binding MarR family transcriptional regulator
VSSPEEVADLLRQMSGQNLLLSEAIARHAGLRPADLEVLGVVEQDGPVTAGELGKVTGLSPAAVTGLIDRLEHAGVARRRPDKSDRRRVLVEVTSGAARVAGLYTTLEQDTLATLRRYTPRQLRTVADFLRDMYAIGVDHVARLESPGDQR